jgi:hypothetical protein
MSLPHVLRRNNTWGTPPKVHKSSIRRLLGFLPLCRRVSQDVYVMLGGGTSRCLWLGGDGAPLPMVKRACKRSSNFYGKSNVNVINKFSTVGSCQEDAFRTRRRRCQSKIQEE